MGNRADLCPVCGGSGKYREGGEVRKCHGCGGQGWVVVPQFNPLPSDAFPVRPPVPYRYGPPSRWERFKCLVGANVQKGYGVRSPKDDPGYPPSLDEASKGVDR